MTTPRRALVLVAAILATAWLLPAAPAQAQPFSAWINLQGQPQNGFINIPDSPAFHFTTAITLEAWVNVTDPGGCSSILGKNYQQAWWVGICGTTLRSYLRGSSSLKNGGIIPVGQWTHIAVTWDGTERRHYINGELIASFAETAPLTTSTADIQIGSDDIFPRTPHGGIDEVRIWSIARTQAQLRAAINVVLSGSEPGLVALYHLDSNTNDATGAHNGTAEGTGVSYGNFPVIISCGSNTATSLCLLDHFAVSARFRTGAPGAAESQAHTVDCPNDGSGLFWFFSPDNWEIQAKAINGCGLNDRFWVFSAATTNVFYRMEVLDVRDGSAKIYFNYQGPPAPAVTDTNAFATCP